MANVINMNPIAIDTTGTIYASGQPTVIRAIKAVGMAAGDVALVQDANSNTFWSEKAATANYSTNLEDFNLTNLSMRTLNGLKVTIPAGGTVYIWKG